MPKNYYIILGISSDSSQREIKSAYRRLAKAFHPDIYKDKHSPFPVIQEAYAVLSDPSRRQAYDRTIQQRRSEQWRQPRPADPPRPSSRVAVEPLNPGYDRPPAGRPMPAGFFQLHRPPFDLFFERLFSTFGHVQDSHRDRSAHHRLELSVTTPQAEQGGQVRLLLPAELRCPECGGFGSRGWYQCWRCGGAGMISGEVPVLIDFPAGIKDGHSLTYRLRHPGLQHHDLAVTFRVC